MRGSDLLTPTQVRNHAARSGNVISPNWRHEIPHFHLSVRMQRFETKRTKNLLGLCATHDRNIFPKMTTARQRVRFPQQSRSSNRVDVILNTARDIFLTDGEGAVIMKTIRAIVGGSHGGIYRYFADRVEVVDALVARDRARAEELLHVNLKAAGATTEAEVLEIAVRALVELRTSVIGSVSLSTNAMRLAPGQDHVSLFAEHLAARVLSTTSVSLSSERTSHYVTALTVIDAVLIGASRGASWAVRAEIVSTCLELLELTCGGGGLRHVREQQNPGTTSRRIAGTLSTRA